VRAKEVLDVIRGAIRPYLAFIFPTTVVIIGSIVAFKLLPIAARYIDREIALIIVTTVLALVTAITTAAATIMAFYFGERATKSKEEK